MKLANFVPKDAVMQMIREGVSITDALIHLSGSKICVICIFVFLNEHLSLTSNMSCSFISSGARQVYLLSLSKLSLSIESLQLLLFAHDPATGDILETVNFLTKYETYI